MKHTSSLEDVDKIITHRDANEVTPDEVLVNCDWMFEPTGRVI